MKTCKAPGCDRTDIKGYGYCNKHYQRFRIHGDVSPPQTPKGFALEHAVEYRCYTAIKTRCYNEKCPPYKNYGGRGIKMCDRWLGSDGFVNFFADMGQRPGKGYSLDRIDNNGDYSPDNCRWTDMKTQNNNRRSNRFFTYNGETLSESQWADKMGINRGTLHQRLKRMPIEQALTMKKQEKKDWLYKLAKERGVDKLRAYKRLQRGWSLEDALNLPPQIGKKYKDIKTP